MKSFFEWFFGDKLVFSSNVLDVASIRLGRTVASLGGLWWIGFFVFMTIWYGGGRWLEFYDKIPHPLYWFACLMSFIIGPWIVFRAIRMVFWLVDGFIPKRDGET